jgi:prefoldin alpha subunit
MNMDEEKLQKQYMQFQMLQQQIEHISQQAELLSEQNAELDISKEAISSLTKMETDNEVLASIADGIFIKTKLSDNQKLIVNVGSEVTVEKSVPEVIALLEKQQTKIRKNQVAADSMLHEFSEQAMKIYQDLQKAVGDK